MKRMRKHLVWTLLLPALFFIIGCGDSVYSGAENKDTTEAKASEVSQHLDSGDYQWVLDNADQAGSIDYSAAAMGLAGITPSTLITALNDMADTSSKAVSAKSSGSGSNDLTPITNLALNPSALKYLRNAKVLIQADLAQNPTDNDLNLQMTMTSLIDTIVALAQVGQTNSASISGGFNPADGISEAEAIALGDFILAHSDVLVDTDGDGTADTSLVSIVASDVADVVATLPNSGLGTDSNLYEALLDVTQGSGSINYDGTGSVTAADISNYLVSVLGN